jgi:glycosyltransferase involved in cell wall biosynthesis
MSGPVTVLHLINTMEWGGVRKHVLDLADGLTAHGVRSCIAAWIPPGDILHGDPRVTHLPLYGAESSTKSPSGFLAAIRTLRLMLQQEEVQILHMHSRYATLLGSLAVRGKRVHRVYTVHNTFDDLRWLPWYPPDVIAPALSVQEHFLERQRGAEHRRMRVIAHGVSIPTLEQIFPELSPRFCFAGRLCEEKGVRILYSALLRLRDAGARLPVVDIIGNGPLFKWLQENVKLDFSSDSIRLHGHVDNPAALIAGATALIFPSVRLDSAPYITLEAMALGVPVIASDLEVLRHLVLPNETGVTFPAGNSAALAEAMQHAMAEPDAMRDMGLRGRDLVQERFGIERMCAETAAFYRTVMQS